MSDTTKLQVTSLPGGINPPHADGAPRQRVAVKLKASRRIVLKLKARRS